jgi:hypothetical protein
MKSVYSSRSEVIRDARAYLSKYEISKFEKGNLTANPISLFGKHIWFNGHINNDNAFTSFTISRTQL